MTERTAQLPPRADEPERADLRVRMEGGYELLEQARERYRELHCVLAPARRQGCLPVERARLEEVRRAEPDVERALDALERLNERLELDHKASSKRLVRELRTAREQVARALSRCDLEGAPGPGGTFTERLDHALGLASEQSLVPAHGALPETGGIWRHDEQVPSRLLFAFAVNVALYYLAREWLSLIGAKGWAWFVVVSSSSVEVALFRRLRRLRHRRAWLTFSPTAGEVVLWTGNSRPVHARRVRKDAKWRGLALRSQDQAVDVLIQSSTRGYERPVSFPLTALDEARDFARRTAGLLAIPLRDGIGPDGTAHVPFKKR